MGSIKDVCKKDHPTYQKFTKLNETIKDLGLIIYVVHGVMFVYDKEDEGSKYLIESLGNDNIDYLPADHMNEFRMVKFNE